MFQFWNFNSQKSLFINDFKEVRYESSELLSPSLKSKFVRNKPGGVLLEYYDNDNRIGYIRYYITTGQIGLFFIDKEYQNRGLGKQILSNVIKELKMNNCKGVWAVTTTNHPF
jgi:ribosomal protein S18 acetylase RimI-like enzyme